MQEYKTSLVIKNVGDNTETSFDITAKGLLPKVTEKLTFSKIKCGEKFPAQLTLPNLSSTKMRFDIETDLEEIVEGRDHQKFR